MKNPRLLDRAFSARVFPVLTASILTISAPWLSAANPDTWNNFTGFQQWSVGPNWLDGTAPLTGDATADLTFGGSGAQVYTATNDLVGILLNTLMLNSTSTATETIGGNSLDFRLDDTAAGITQNGSGGFIIGANIIATAALTLNGTGTGVTALNGVISGGGALNVTAGTWQIGNSANSFTGGLTINSGALIEVIPSAAGNQAVNLTRSATAGYLGTTASPITINGGTLKVTTKGNGGNNSGITIGGLPLTFGANGGVFDLRNTSGVVGSQGGGIVTSGGGDLNLTLNNTLANTVVVKFNGGQVGMSTGNATDGNWSTGNNCLRIASMNGGGPLRLEITNGAMYRSSIANVAPPVTIRGVIGGDPTSGPAGTGNTGLSTTTARVALDSTNEHAYASLRLEGAVQIGLVGATRAINGTIVVAGSAGGNAGYVDFTGRGTGTQLNSTLNNPGGTAAGQNVLWLLRAGANSNAGTLTIEDGGIAAFDTRQRTDGTTNGNGVALDGPAIIAAGGALRFHQSVSNFTPGITATTANAGDVIIFGDITGQGSTTKESVLDVALPEPQPGATIASGVPATLTATTTVASERPYGGLRFDDSRGTADFIVNGTGFGGLRVNGVARPNALIQGGGADPVLTTTKVASVLSEARLARVSGTGGYLTIAPTGQTFDFPAFGEWFDSDVGLKVVNHNTGGTDVSLGALSTWSKNLAVDTGATLETGAGLIMTGGTLYGTGTVISTGGLLTVDSGAAVAPGLSIGTINVGNFTLNGTLQIETTSTPTSDLLAVNGGLTLGGSSILAFPGTNTYAPQNYILATYTGTLTGTFGSITGLPLDYTINYGAGTNSNIRIIYTVIPTEIWNGNISGAWDTTTANWQGPSTFVNGTKARFDDSASGPNFTVTVTGGNVTPTLVTVDNTNTNYTLVSTPGAAISGLGSLVKTGSGTLTMMGPATYTGGTSINNGTLVLGSNNALPDEGAVTVAAPGTLDTQGRTDTVADLTVNGTVTGGGTLDVLSLTLGSGATFTPNLVLEGPLTKTGAVGSTLPAAVNLSADIRTLTVDSSTAPELTLNGAVSNGGIVKAGSGTLVLGNAGNSYDLGTTLNAGTLKIGVAGGLPSGSRLEVNGGTLDGNNTAITVSSLSGTGGTLGLGSGSLHVVQIENTTFSGAATGFASITKSDTGELTLNGSGNTYTGGLYVDGGIAIVASVSAPGFGVSHVQPNGTLQVGANLTNPILLEGGTLATQNSPGQVTANELTAATGTTSRVLIAPANNLFANSEVILLGTLRGSGDINVEAGLNNAQPDGGPGFRLRGTAASDFSGTITAAQSVKLEMQTTVAGTFSPAGTGKFVLTGGTYFTNSLNGNYSVINLRNNSTGNTVFGNNFEIAGSEFAMFNMPGGSPAGSITQIGNLKIGDGQAIGVYRNAGNLQELKISTVTLTGGTSTFASNPIAFNSSGSANLTLGAITETAASNVVLAPGSNNNAVPVPGIIVLSAANNYSGSTTLPVGTTGTVRLGAAGALPITTTLTVEGGVLDLNNVTTSNDQTVASLAGTGGAITNSDSLNLRTLTVDQDVTTTFTGAINGNVALEKDGTGSLTLDGALDFTVLDVNDGTLNLNSALPFATISDNGGILNINGDVDSSIVNANAGTVNISLSETLSELNIGATGVVVITSPGPAPAPALAAGDGGSPIPAAPELDAAIASAQPVPEPGSVGLVAAGLLGLLIRRRRKRN